MSGSEPAGGRPSAASRPRVTPRPESAIVTAQAAIDAARQSITLPGPVAVRPRPTYMPALDGLRALAVAAVMAFHLGRLGGGFIGVDVFFVISGFLITRLLLAERERSGTVAFGAFWGRRFRRLLPALMVILVFVALASRLWMPAWRLTEIRNDGLGALAYVANWRFVFSGQSYFTQGVGPSPLRHTWSLAIEEQFYVLWPLVVMAIFAFVRNRFRLAVLIVAGVGGIASALWMAVAPSMGVDLTRLYYGTDSRAFALLAGAWLAAWWDPVVADAPRRVAAAAHSRPLTHAATLALLPLAVLAVVAAEDTSWFYRVGFQSVAVLSTIIVAGLAMGEGRVAQALGAPIPCWIGRRSYGIYLWSWPIQVFAVERFALGGAMLDLVVVPTTLALATLSYRFIEEPIRTRWSTVSSGWQADSQPDRPVAHRPPWPVPRLARTSTAIVAVVGVIVLGAAGAPASPSYLRVSDTEAAAGALATSSGFGPDRGVAQLAAVRAIAPPTSAPPSTAPGEITVPTTAPAYPPGPFDATADVLVDPSATADPIGVSGRPMQIMIAGDSVGWSLGWQPSKRLTKAVQIEDRAIIGCGLMPPDSSWIVGPKGAEKYGNFCRDQAEAERIGVESGPDVVLLWVGAWEVYDHEVYGMRLSVGTPAYATYLEQRVQDRIDQFRAAGIPTVIPRVPCFGVNAARLGTERYQSSRIAWVNARLSAVAERNRSWVRMIDPSPILCSADGEAIAETAEGKPLRADGAHFDPTSARWFWNAWLAGQMASAFAPAPAPAHSG